MKSSLKNSIFYLLWSTFPNAERNMFKNKKQEIRNLSSTAEVETFRRNLSLMLRKAEWRGLERGEGKPQVGKVPLVRALTSQTCSTNASSSSLSLKATVQVYLFSYSLQMSAVQDLGKCIYFYRFENHKITNMHCVKYAAHNSTLMALREPLNNMLWEETSVHTGLSWARIVLTFWSVWMSHTYARCTVGGETNDTNKWARHMKTFHREIL